MRITQKCDVIKGCPNECNKNGKCAQDEEIGLWKCSCSPGWEGAECEQATEQNCTDKIDNDGGEHRAGVNCKGRQIKSLMIQNWIPTNSDGNFTTIQILKLKLYHQIQF